MVVYCVVYCVVYRVVYRVVFGSLLDSSMRVVAVACARAAIQTTPNSPAIPNSSDTPEKTKTSQPKFIDEIEQLRKQSQRKTNERPTKDRRKTGEKLGKHTYIASL